MREKKVAYTVFWGGKPEGDYLEDLGVEGRIILKLTFIQWERGVD
jgi:hypothetical protein